MLNDNRFDYERIENGSDVNLIDLYVVEQWIDYDLSTMNCDEYRSRVQIKN